MLQPSPLRGSGCNTLSHSGLANVHTRKRMFYPLINTRLRKASIPLKPAPDIVWCPFQLHRCSRYNHRTIFRNHSPRASTSINTRLRRASFQLKPAPDIGWCPFLLRHTRNKHGLSAITTHLVSILNAYKVYNNDCFAYYCYVSIPCLAQCVCLLFCS